MKALIIAMEAFTKVVVHITEVLNIFMEEINIQFDSTFYEFHEMV